MKALLIYSNDKQGKNRAFKKHDYILKKLNTKYEAKSLCLNSLDELKNVCEHVKEDYDILVVTGGDGTLNKVVNFIAPLKEESRPIIGYIPTGTVNDAGKSFGINFSLKKALKIILNGHVVKSDIGMFNDCYFLYVLAIGQYADIPYKTERKKKRKFGRLAYYFLALKEAFHFKKIKAHFETDIGNFDVETPFVLIMNGINVGGFPVNFSNSINDGKFDIYLTKPGLFNGLLHFLFFKIKTKHIKTAKLKVFTSISDPWCVDGEKGICGDLSVKCLQKHISFFAAKKIKN